MSEQSLAALSGLTSNMPALLDQQPIEAISRFNTPYVVFVHPNSGLWSKALARYPDAREAEQFLFKGDDVTRLSPFKYSLLTAKQYWCDGDKDKITKVSFSEKPYPYGECIEAVVLAYVGDKLVPASAQFRTTKTGAIHPMIAAYSEAATPAWGAKSKAHELTLACQKPFMRFYGTVNLGKPRTGRTSGNVYIPAEVTVSPTSAEEWVVLAKHLDASSEVGKEFYDAVNQAQADYDRRVQELQAIASKPLS